MKFGRLFKKPALERSVEQTLRKVKVESYLESKIERISSPLPSNIDVLDRYQAGYNKAATVTLYQDLDTEVYVFHIEEPPISPTVENLYQLVRERFQSMEIEVPEKVTERELVYEKYIHEALKELGYEEAYTKYPELRYYLIRDLVGWRIIDVMMRDPHVEEIDYSSPHGVLSVVVKHDKIASTWVDTNIALNEEELTKLIEFIAFKTGKQISVAQPILEARTPEGYRVAANLKEVGMSPAFTIRKFPEMPLSLTVLLKNKTMSSLMAAYLWTLVENMRFVLVIGGMATGKSLNGKEFTLIRTNSGYTLLTFEKLWKTLVERHPVKRIDEMEVIEDPDIEILTLSESGVKWARPRYIIRHRHKDKMYKITTKTGRELLVTPDHSLLIWSVGDENNRFTIRIVSTKPEEILGKEVYLPYLRWLSLETTNAKGKVADPKFGYILGFYVAEGHINGTIPRLYQAEGDTLRHVLNYLDKLGVKYRVASEKRKPYMKYVSLYDDDIKQYAKMSGGRTREKRVPDIFWSMDEKWRAAFLAGVIDGDGYVDQKNYTIEIATASRELAYGLLYAFASIGVHAYIREKHVKRYPDRTYYRVFVPIGINVDGLFKVMKYLSDEKRKQIEDAMRRSSNHHSETDIIPAEVAYAVGTLLKRSKFGRDEDISFELRSYKYKKENPTFFRVEKLLGDRLYEILPRGIGFDKVEKIEEVDYDDYVYDIEVPDTQNFEANGIFIHNTTVLQAISSVIPRDRKVVCVAPGTRVATNSPRVIDDLFVGVPEVKGNVESVDGNINVLGFRDGDVFWTATQKVHKIHIPKDVKLVKITTEFGIVVTTTPNTKIPVLTENGIVYKPASELEAGDVVFQLAKYEPIEVKEPDIADMLDSHGFRVYLSKPVKNVKFRLVRTFGVKEYLAKKDMLPEPIGLHIRGSKYVLRAPCDKLPDPKHSYLAGYLLGGGEIQPKRRGQHIYRLYLHAVYEIPMSRRAKNVKIPSWMFTAPEEHVKAFIAGLIDSSGIITRKYVEFVSTSKELAEDLAILALRFGAVGRVFEKKRGKRMVYHIRFEGEHALKLAGAIRKYIIKARNVIGCRRLKRSLTSSVPSVVLAYLFNLAKKRGAGLELCEAKVYEGEKGRYISLEDLHKVAKELDIEKDLEKIISDKYVLAYVQKVEEVGHEGIVYDITPKDTQYFFAGNGGFVAVEDTIEDTPELRLAHPRWQALYTRRSVYGTEQDVTLFDLARYSLRTRGQYIIIGEVRDREIQTLVQMAASVSRDTPVLVRINGEIKLARIGDIVDRIYEEAGNPPDWTKVVPKQIIEVLTLTRDGKAEFRPVQWVLRHRADKVYRVKYVGGEVKATGSHSIFVLDEETLDIKVKRVDELKPRDILVSFVKSSPLGERRIIDLGKYIDRNYVIVENDSLKPAYWTGKSIPRYIVLDEDVAKVLGVYLAEGSLHSKIVHTIRGETHRSICFSLGKTEYHMYISSIRKFAEKLGLNMLEDDRGTYVLVDINSTILAEAFKKMFGTDVYTKRVPPELWEADQSTIRAFLEGYMADGFRTQKRKAKTYSTVNEWLSYEIAWLARIAGFSSAVWPVNGTGKNIGRKYWYVEIKDPKQHGADNNIGRLVPLKPLQKLAKMLNPVVTADSKHVTNYFYDKSKRFVRVETAKKILDYILENRRSEISEEARKLIEKIKWLIESEIEITVVKSVEEMPYNDYVYDFSVPDTEAFFGGTIPVLLHNSGHGSLCTFHAEDPETLFLRMTSPPLSVQPSFLLTIAAVVLQQRLWSRKYKTFVRRTSRIWEITGLKPVTREGEIPVTYKEVFAWDPAEDYHYPDNVDDLVDTSRQLQIIAKSNYGEDEWRDAIIWELTEKKKFIEQLVAEGVFDFREVTERIYRKTLELRRVR